MTKPRSTPSIRQASETTCSQMCSSASLEFSALPASYKHGEQIVFPLQLFHPAGQIGKGAAGNSPLRGNVACSVASAHDVVQRGRPFAPADLDALFVHVFQAQPVLPDQRNVAVFEFRFLADFSVVQDDAVGAAAVGNKNGIVSEFDDRMKAADAGIIQNKIVGIAPPTVMTGLLSSSIPFFPSGEEMMRRAIRHGYCFSRISSMFTTLPFCTRDVSVDRFVSVHLQNNAVDAGIGGPARVGFLGRGFAVNHDGCAFRVGSDVDQPFAFRNGVCAEDPPQQVRALAVF